MNHSTLKILAKSKKNEEILNNYVVEDISNYAIKKCVGMYDPLTKPFLMKRKNFQNISVMCTYFV